MKAKDLIKHVEKRGGRVLRQAGSHVICELPNHAEVVIPDHGHKDLGKGLCCKLLKMLAAAGIPYAVWLFCIQPFLQSQGWL